MISFLVQDKFHLKHYILIAPIKQKKIKAVLKMIFDASLIFKHQMCESDL